MPEDFATGPQISIAVVGTGALGSALLAQLAAHGFRSVLLVDPDAPEPANLPLSPFLARALEANCVNASERHQQPPLNKAEQIAAAAEQLYNLRWRAHPCEIADVGWQELQSADVICCCTDSALSRVETAFAARMLRKPMLDGAVFGGGFPEGRVSLFSPAPEAACYLCGMGESRRAAVLGYAASASLGCRLPDESPAMTGTLATLERVAAKMVVSLLQFAFEQPPETRSSAVKTSLPTAADTASSGSEPAWRDQPIVLLRSATCPWHDRLPTRLEPLPWESPLDNSLRSLHDCSPSMEVQLAWPICTEAVCAACGQHSQPFLRMAAVRRKASCAHCGLTQLQPLCAAHRIRAGGALGGLSPRQLGLPQRHLYWLRDTAGMNGIVQRGPS